jgi:hypothetical protein
VADAVFVPPGYGALVRERQSPNAEIGTVFLLTDQGIRYPLRGADAPRALGYGGISPVPVAATVLGLLPVGVPLDVASAQRLTAG